MRSGITFAELAKLNMENRSTQGPLTLEEMREQVLRLHKETLEKEKNEIFKGRAYKIK